MNLASKNINLIYFWRCLASFKDKAHRKSKIFALVMGLILFVFILLPFRIENRFEKYQENTQPASSVFPDLSSVYEQMGKDYPKGKISVQKKEIDGLTHITVIYRSTTMVLPWEVIQRFGVEACSTLKTQGKRLDKYVVTIDSVQIPNSWFSKLFPIPVAYKNSGVRCDKWLKNTNN